MSDAQLLKIAVPNKGSLSESAARMLKEAGYRMRSDSKELVLIDEDNQVEFYYLRPRDIAVYVGEGTLDLGITGRDMLIDSRACAEELLSLGFGKSKFRFAAPIGGIDSIEGLSGARIATSYPGLLESYLADKGISARLIHLDGAVESSIRLGVADAIADVVETGTTLRKAGLELFGDVICRSEAVLIKRSGTVSPEGVDQLIRRLSGVIVARDYVMMDYNIPKSKLSEAAALTPGLESPTVSELASGDWLAVRAMVERKASQQIMDELWQVGARAILVTEIAACRI